jgi:hypothetical protein
MLYNCGNKDADRCGPAVRGPRGIQLHRADHPWGPWEPPINVFDPGPDRGYGYFMHQKFAEVKYDDGLAEPGLHKDLGHNSAGCGGWGFREECWGGEYGPYLVPQWFTKTPDGGHSIVYTLSSWAPYQVHLMRTILAKRGDRSVKAPSPGGQTLPPARLENPGFGTTGPTCHLGGWQGLGDAFGVYRGPDACWVTTYTQTKGDQATGALYQDFTVGGSTKALQFKVHGGEGTVRLHRGEEIVRETRGRSGHEPRNSPPTRACWNLGDYGGETLRVAIVDHATGPWGFIGVTGFEFLDAPCAKGP